MSNKLLDNRTVHQNQSLIDEVINDDTPLDEGANPKDDPEAAGHIEDPENEEVVIEDEQPEDDQEAILSDEEEIDEETGEAKKKTPQQSKPPEKQPLPDVEERLAEQRREATILNEKNKQLSDAFKRANEIKEPTEEELQQAARRDGFDWEDLTMFERSQFKKNFLNEQRLSILNEVGSKVSNIDQWAQSVDKYLDDNEINQTNKQLIGKEQAFRSFAMKESHRGASMDLLVSAFLHDLPATPKKPSGSLMLTRTGGERIEKKNNLQDAEYVQSLRKTNPKEYNRLVAKGKIQIEI